jgi:hypothetical protein
MDHEFHVRRNDGFHVFDHLDNGFEHAGFQFRPHFLRRLIDHKRLLAILYSSFALIENEDDG